MCSSKHLGLTPFDRFFLISPSKEKTNTLNSVGDKAKEAKEREERDAENQAHAGHSYHTPDPSEMGGNHDPSGLPWGSLSLQHVVAKGRSRGSDSHRGGSSRDKDQSGGSGGYAQEPVYDERDAYYEQEPDYYEEHDRVYYDYGSGGSGSAHSR